MTKVLNGLRYLWTHEAALVMSALGAIVGILAQQFDWWSLTSDQLYAFIALLLGVGVGTRQLVYSKATHVQELVQAEDRGKAWPDLPVGSSPAQQGPPPPPPAPLSPGFPSRPRL